MAPTRVDIEPTGVLICWRRYPDFLPALRGGARMEPPAHRFGAVHQGVGVGGVQIAVRVVHEMPVAPTQVIAAGLVIELTAVALLAFQTRLAVIIVLLALEGINYGILITEAQLTLVSTAGAKRSASAMAVYTLSTNMAQMLGGVLVAVFVSQQSGRAAVMTVAAAVVVLSVAYLLVWARTELTAPWCRRLLSR